MDSNIELAQRFFETLRTTERLAEPELKSYQDNLLVRLVEHAVANTKFYREAIGDRLEGLDLSVPEDWRKLPTTNRSVLSQSLIHI